MARTLTEACYRGCRNFTGFRPSNAQSAAGVLWPAACRLRYHAVSAAVAHRVMVETSTVESPDVFPAERSEFLLRGPAGAIECAVDVAQTALKRDITMVICHPHPEHGGTMHNKVVTIIERAMRELGIRTVRFNFRGVGKSEGTFDDGYGETDDLFAVVEWVRRTRPHDALWLSGFSFGAYVSARAASQLSLGQLISIAPPVEKYEFSNLPRPECPWLVVQGDEDDVVTVDSVQAWAERTDPPPQLVVMPQAGHFFHRRLMDLRGLLKNGVRDQLNGGNPDSSDD